MEVFIAVFTHEADRLPRDLEFPVAATPSFVPFDSTAELWTDYWAYFLIFLGANSVQQEKRAQVFLTNLQTSQQCSFSTVTTRQHQRPESGTDRSIAVETEEAAKVAKEMVYESKPSPSTVNQIRPPGRQNRGQKGGPDFPYGTCPRCEE